MAIDERYPQALHEGTVLAGQYTIEKVLGQGGFGITYRAVDHKTGQRVAIKEFFPDTLSYRDNTSVISYPGERSENFEYGREGFLQEAKTLAEFIGNENIVRIHCYFEENNTAYFVMDYIEGKSFDEYIKERGGKVTVQEAENILLPIMDALYAVHSKGIVHRDVTPDNIYITNNGVVKLLDFGAARYSLGDKSRSLDVILKHGFAPKEQYTRRGKQGPFTDVYSLAATFYFAITGKRPPDSVERLDDDDLIPPSNLGINITEYQEKAILQGLSVQPGDRFQSMADFKLVFLNEKVFTNNAQSFQNDIPVALPVSPPPVPVQNAGGYGENNFNSGNYANTQYAGKNNNKKVIAIVSIVSILIISIVVAVVVGARSSKDDADNNTQQYSDNTENYDDTESDTESTTESSGQQYQNIADDPNIIEDAYALEESFKDILTDELGYDVLYPRKDELKLTGFAIKQDDITVSGYGSSEDKNSVRDKFIYVAEEHGYCDYIHNYPDYILIVVWHSNYNRAYVFAYEGQDASEFSYNQETGENNGIWIDTSSNYDTETTTESSGQQYQNIADDPNIIAEANNLLKATNSTLADEKCYEILVPRDGSVWCGICIYQDDTTNTYGYGTDDDLDYAIDLFVSEVGGYDGYIHNYPNYIYIIAVSRIGRGVVFAYEGQDETGFYYDSETGESNGIEIATSK